MFVESGFNRLNTENEVRRLLCLRCRLHNQRLVIAQPLKLAFDIRSRTVNRPLNNLGLPAQKRRAHFGNQFLFAIRVGTETAVLGNRCEIRRRQPVRR